MKRLRRTCWRAPGCQCRCPRARARNSRCKHSSRSERTTNLVTWRTYVVCSLLVSLACAAAPHGDAIPLFHNVAQRMDADRVPS